jgi:hypothetical protein
MAMGRVEKRVDACRSHGEHEDDDGKAGEIEVFAAAREFEQTDGSAGQHCTSNIVGVPIPLLAQESLQQDVPGAAAVGLAPRC